MDAAGVARSAPPGTGLAADQRVAVLLDYGCWQEVVSVPAARVLPLPEGMSFEAAAAAPLNYLTALFALAWRAHAQPGDTLLVHGAAGGVGTAAIQLGRALGLRTLAVVSEEAKKDVALRRGAHHAVLSGGWLTAVRDLIGEQAVDIVVDPGRRGPDDRQSSLAGTRRPSSCCGIYRGEILTIKVNRLLLGNTSVLGAASREFSSSIRQRWPPCGPSWSSCDAPERCLILRVEPYPFADARSALGAIADRKAQGKIVLSRQA
jgi:NADPH:quinone reductase